MRNVPAGAFYLGGGIEVFAHRLEEEAGGGLVGDPALGLGELEGLGNLDVPRSGTNLYLESHT